MQELAPEYLAEIAKQIAFLGAFLGGFSAAFLGSLLVASSHRRTTAWAIASAAAAAVSFIVAVVGATTLVVALNPSAPANVARAASLMNARVVTVLGFTAGLYALLGAVGLSGFAWSRRAGVVTSSLAAAGAVLATWALLGF
jgi:hypothetical protein